MTEANGNTGQPTTTTTRSTTMPDHDHAARTYYACFTLRQGSDLPAMDTDHQANVWKVMHDVGRQHYRIKGKVVVKVSYRARDGESVRDPAEFPLTDPADELDRAAAGLTA